MTRVSGKWFLFALLLVFSMMFFAANLNSVAAASSDVEGADGVYVHSVDYSQFDSEEISEADGDVSVDATPPSGRTFSDGSLTGTLSYEVGNLTDYSAIAFSLKLKDENGNLSPAEGINVRLRKNYHFLIFYDESVENTTSNGTFHRLFSGDANLEFYIYAGNSLTDVFNNKGSVKVVPSSKGDTYCYEIKDSIQVPKGYVANIDLVISCSTAKGKAFQVANTLILAENYANARTDKTISKTTAVFPYAIDAYSVTSKEIRLREASYNNYFTIMHEFGHNFSDFLGLVNTDKSDHGFNIDLSEEYGKDSGIRLAWAEALAHLFSVLVQQYYGIITNAFCLGRDGFQYNVEDDPHWRSMGEGNEGGVLGVLYDLYDKFNAEEQHDLIYLNHSQIWRLLFDSKATTLSAFINYCYNSYIIDVNCLGKILSACNMSATDAAYSYNSGTSFITFDPGNSNVYRNNAFEIIFYNNNVEFYRTAKLTEVNYIKVPTPDSYTIKYALSAQDIAKLTSVNGSLSFALKGYQASTPATGGYLSGQVPITGHITHNYNLYELYLPTLHKAKCSCGAQITEAHRFSPVGPGGMPKCLDCGYAPTVIIEPDFGEQLMSASFPYVIESVFGQNPITYFMRNTHEH